MERVCLDGRFGGLDVLGLFVVYGFVVVFLFFCFLLGFSPFFSSSLCVNFTRWFFFMFVFFLLFAFGLFFSEEDELATGNMAQSGHRDGDGGDGDAKEKAPRLPVSMAFYAQYRSSPVTPHPQPSSVTLLQPMNESNSGLTSSSFAAFQNLRLTSSQPPKPHRQPQTQGQGTHTAPTRPPRNLVANLVANANQRPPLLVPPGVEKTVLEATLGALSDTESMMVLEEMPCAPDYGQLPKTHKYHAKSTSFEAHGDPEVLIFLVKSTTMIFWSVKFCFSRSAQYHDKAGGRFECHVSDRPVLETEMQGPQPNTPFLIFF